MCTLVTCVSVRSHVHCRREGVGGIHHSLCSPITGWLMKHSTHHAASVIYQENDNPFPVPNPDTHCSQLPVFLIVRLHGVGMVFTEVQSFK